MITFSYGVSVYMMEKVLKKSESVLLIQPTVNDD